MIARTLLAVFLLATPAAAELVVSDGDYFARLTADSEPTSIEGGRVDRLTVLESQVTISGGSVGQVTMTGNIGASLSITGGELSWNPGQLGASVELWEPYTLVRFAGPHFRMLTTAVGQRKIEGILADGSFLRLIVAIDSELCDDACPYDLRFDLAGEITGDIDGNSSVDLDDLNTVRNNFGSPGFDIDTLNDVRNHFGMGSQFTIDASHAVAGNPVPEPAGWIIGTIALALSCVIFRRYGAGT
jgi:hypothetical protein